MSAASDDIVITGAGMVTCLGLDRETTWRAVRAGRCGMGPLPAMESPLPPGSTGGQAPDLPDDFEPGRPREVRYLRRALIDAWADAGLDHNPLPYAPTRCAAVLGTTLHGMRSGGAYLRGGDPAPLRNFLASSVLRSATHGFSLEGLSTTTCSACSSSLGSVAWAVSLLRSGQFDLVVAGGYDPISEYVYAGFNSLRLVSPGALRPFARDRAGMKLAEGYAIVVLERRANAHRRNRASLATVLGFGESSDAHHLTQPHPAGEGAARAMAAALDSAGLAPQDIDLIVAHATGTPDNDAGEYAALARVFGEHLPRVPVVGFKSHLGHTLGGAGAVELILSAMALRDQTVPPCANVQHADVDFPGLNLAAGRAAPARICATLSTSLGFGGANTCVVLGPDESPDTPGSEPQATTRISTTSSVARERPGREVYITGVGVVLPGMVGNEAFLRRLADPAPRRVARDAGPVADESILHLLNARRVRRMSEYVKLTLAAAAVALQDAGVTDVPAFAATCAAVLGSTHGSANYSKDYYGQIVREGIAAANPMLFAEGVPNAAAAHVSLMMSVKGPCQTLIGSRTAGLDALRLAATRIAEGRWDRAIVSAGEEYSPTVNEGYKSCGLYGGPGADDDNESATMPFAPSGNGFVTGSGAVALILESRASLEAWSARPRATAQAFASATAGSARAHIEAAARVLADLGDPHALMSSANGTWIDRIEAAAIRRTLNPSAAVSSIYGHAAETFSAGPLASLAAVLLGGALPRLFGPGVGEADDRREAGERFESFGVLCTDYAGAVSGARIGLCQG